jgi:hypothetical protein
MLSRRLPWPRAAAWQAALLQPNLLIKGITSSTSDVCCLTASLFLSAGSFGFSAAGNLGFAGGFDGACDHATSGHRIVKARTKREALAAIIMDHLKGCATKRAGIGGVGISVELLVNCFAPGFAKNERL